MIPFEYLDLINLVRQSSDSRQSIAQRTWVRTRSKRDVTLFRVYTAVNQSSSMTVAVESHHVLFRATSASCTSMNNTGTTHRSCSSSIIAFGYIQIVRRTRTRVSINVQRLFELLSEIMSPRASFIGLFIERFASLSSYLLH
jgi:hypothetical protein